MFLNFLLNIEYLIKILCLRYILIVLLILIYYIFMNIWILTFVRILNTLAFRNHCDWFIFCVHIIALICDWYFTCQNFYIIFLTNTCFLIFFANWNTISFCFHKIFFLFLDFIKLIYYFWRVTLIFCLNSFSFVYTFFYFWLLLLHKLIN